MAADARATQTFKDGRSSLRETAKWLVSGIATAATLTVGSAAFSQLGALPFGCRFSTAVAVLALAAIFWWMPFAAAVKVLKSEMLRLPDFVDALAKTKATRTAEEGEHVTALEAANAKLRGFLPFPSVADLVHECDRLRSVVFSERRAPDPIEAKTSAQKELEALEPLEVFCLETCSSALVTMRFDTLMDALWKFGSLSLICFAVFAWAANPPKDGPKMLDKPIDVSRALTLDPTVLKTAGLDPACYGPGAALIAFAGIDPGPKTALLVPPHPTSKSCPLQKVTLSADYKIIKID